MTTNTKPSKEQRLFQITERQVISSRCQQEQKNWLPHHPQRRSPRRCGALKTETRWTLDPQPSAAALSESPAMSSTSTKSETWVLRSATGWEVDHRAS